jgi:hypothetical protein
LLTARGVTILNGLSFSNSETEIKNGIYKKLKSTRTFISITAGSYPWSLIQQ